MGHSGLKEDIRALAVRAGIVRCDAMWPGEALRGARSQEQFAMELEQARAALRLGDAAVAAYLLDEPLKVVEIVARRRHGAQDPR
jgi:hypothetical protein